MVMSGQTDEQVLGEHFKRFPQIGFVLDPSSFLLVMGALQLALRHPAFLKTSSGQKVRVVVDNLIERVSDGDAYIKSLLKRGDDPAHDVATEYAQQAAPKGGPDFTTSVNAAADMAAHVLVKSFKDKIKRGGVERFLAMMAFGENQGLTLEACAGTAMVDFVASVVGHDKMGGTYAAMAQSPAASPAADDPQRRLADVAEKALAFFTNINTYDPRLVAIELAEALQGVGRAIEMDVVTSQELVAPVWCCEEIGSLYDC